MQTSPWMTTVLAVMLLVTNEAKMTNSNQQHLKEANTEIRAFQTDLETERLRRASISLDSISIPLEPNPKLRTQLRLNSLQAWLQLNELIQTHLDPLFNPKDLPEVSVQPPPTSAGVIYPPGADPNVIDDPNKRAAYVNAIAAGRAKADRYRLQTDLHRFGPYAEQRMEAFVHSSYSATKADESDFQSAVNKMVTDPTRKKHLLSLLSTK